MATKFQKEGECMKGIGTDIVQIKRIEQSLEKQPERFVARLLTANEQQVYKDRGQPVRFVANRFAAKEAISKALGTGIAKGINFVDMEILPGESGEPKVTLLNKAQERLKSLGGQSVMVSISDERDYAVAFAVIT